MVEGISRRASLGLAAWMRLGAWSEQETRSVGM
jgi:hypothetical protein